MLISVYLSCESRELQEQMSNLPARVASVLGLQRPTSTSPSIESITSLPGSINTRIGYGRVCRNLFEMGVTPEMIIQREGDILNMLNQPQDTATSDRGNGSSNSAQLLTVSLPFPK